MKNYQNMSKEELLKAIVKSERIIKNLLKNGLERIAGMQNLSLNELEQIERMNNLSKNKLEQIAKNRRIKTNKNASKEDLLNALLKSNKSHPELRKSKDNNTEIGETKKIFNELRNNFSKEEIKKIRKKFRFREGIIEYLKELEQKDSLTKQEKQDKKHYTKKLKYQYNDNEDLDYKGIKQIENLYDEINKIDKDYYKPIRTNGAFGDNYMEYESRGDRDRNLSLEDYPNIIRPFLRDMINNHKTYGEWKIQLTMRINLFLL